MIDGTESFILQERDLERVFPQSGTAQYRPQACVTVLSFFPCMRTPCDDSIIYVNEEKTRSLEVIVFLQNDGLRLLPNTPSLSR